MKISTVNFVMSNSDVRKCPSEKLPEYAFIGRSNVGKSSLINMLTGRKNLAKTSVKPGKTQLINHFKINNEWFLVDLPGYGYAKVSRQIKNSFSKIIYDYILKRRNLVCLFVLIDCRHEPQKIDLDFIETLGNKQIPFHIIFTKTDKISKQKLSQNIYTHKNELLKYWEELPKIFESSATSKNGKDEILDYIKNLNNNLKIN